MSQIVPFRIEGAQGETIPVEVDEELSGVVRSARPGELAEEARQSLEAALERVAPAAGALIGKLRAAVEGVDSVNVQFGIKLSGEVGAIVAKTSVDANFTVSVTWKARA
jgi:hypothetical protein